MRVCIDKTREHCATPRIDNLAIATYQPFDLSTWADAFDSIATNEQRSIRNDGQFAQLGANARTRRPGESDELRAID